MLLLRGIRGGAIASLPIQLAIIPFAMITGAFAADSGLTALETAGWTIIIFAGAAQIASLQLLVDGAPAAIAVLTGLCMNLRFMMYSASMQNNVAGAPLAARLGLGALLTDQTYGVCMLHFRPELTEGPLYRISYAIGSGMVTGSVWFLGTAAGWSIGAQIPPSWPVDFMIPVCFIAITAPLLDTYPKVFAAAVAVGAALFLREMPYNMGLITAAALGIGAGLIAEARRG